MSLFTCEHTGFTPIEVLSSDINLLQSTVPMQSRPLLQRSHLVILPSADTETSASTLSSHDVISCLVQLTCHTGCRCFLEHALRNRNIIKADRKGVWSDSNLFCVSDVRVYFYTPLSTQTQSPHLLLAIHDLMLSRLWTL